MLLEQGGDGVGEGLWTDSSGQRLLGKARCLGLVQRGAALAPFPDRFAAQFRLEAGQFARQRFHRAVEGRDGVSRMPLAAEDVRGHAQREAHPEQRLSWMLLQRDVEMHRARREMLQMLFQFGDFLPQLFPQLLMRMDVLGDKVPKQRGQFARGHNSLRMMKSLLTSESALPLRCPPGERHCKTTRNVGSPGTCPPGYLCSMV